MIFYAKEPEDLVLISKNMINLVGENKVFAFKGEMGVGKTTFISYLAKVLGVEEPVSSPTFGYVKEYSSESYGIIYHFDLYRIHSEEEAYDIGIEEYIYGDNIVFIEWPEIIEHLLPKNFVWINLEKREDGSRMIEIKV